MFSSWDVLNRNRYNKRWAKIQATQPWRHPNSPPTAWPLAAFSERMCHQRPAIRWNPLKADSSFQMHEDEPSGKQVAANFPSNLPLKTATNAQNMVLSYVFQVRAKWTTVLLWVWQIPKSLKHVQLQLLIHIPCVARKDIAGEQSPWPITSWILLRDEAAFFWSHFARFKQEHTVSFPYMIHVRHLYIWGWFVWVCKNLYGKSWIYPPTQ